MQKTALISVSDKTGIADFVKFLAKQNYRIISTGGTFKHLKENGLSVFEVSEITNFPEILDGRVKTLHPFIHGGILAKRNQPEHLRTLEKQGINTIDIVVVNLYPFFENANKNLSDEALVEFIDIGGPTMLRAAAKSFSDVTVITDPLDYEVVKKEISEHGMVSLENRKKLAGKVFNLTAAYDAAIASKLLNDDFPPFYNISYKKEFNLRYGENPHQRAAYYTSTISGGALKDFKQRQGKELSFNNLRDLDLAWKVLCEFEEPACCAVKHSTPCGVALGDDLLSAYKKAHDCDPISIFGGIVTFNRKVTREVAEKCNEIFLEIIAAPAFDPEALSIFSKKKNLRVIEITSPLKDRLQIVQVDGGLLVQEIDGSFSTDFKNATEKKVSEKEIEDLIFALKVVKHVKSNAIVVAKDKQTLGIGTGQTNRIWAAKEAIDRAKEKTNQGLVLASDAFFPFPDVVELCAKEGISAIIQPGGSLKDQESINAANQHNIGMIISGMRHFLH